MKLDVARLIGPLVAGALLVLIGQQTLGSLHASGVWGHRPAAAVSESPYAGLERLLRSAPGATPAGLRDPFDFGRAPVAAPAKKRPVAPQPVAPSVPARPVLTSIVWLENNPSATLRWNGRDYPVQANTLFDEFRVRSINRDQVTLEHGAEILVLKLPKKGD